VALGCAAAGDWFSRLAPASNIASWSPVTHTGVPSVLAH
jgi:hypothetical protein